MEFGEKDFKKLLIMLLLFTLAVLVFLIIRPIFIPIVLGLLLAYIFTPLYRLMYRFIPEKNTSAAIVTVLAILIMFIPMWFIIPLVIEQLFEIFRFTQTLDVQKFVQNLFSGYSESFSIQLTVSLNGVISKLSATILNSLTEFLFNIPKLLLGLFITVFVFFFSMRDADKLGEFVSGISPINKSKEKFLVQRFKAVTDSLIYGQIIVGVIQGLLAGLALFIFGVPNALTLTVIAVFLCILPFTGAFLIWVPVSIYLFSSASFPIAITYFLYNLLFVSTIDNVLRSYIVSRKTDLSQAVIVVGMVGGIFVFGVMGIILGPLILAYLVTFLQSYRERTLYTLFTE